MENKKQKMKLGELLLKYITDKNHGTIQNTYNNLDERIICDNPESPIGHTYGESYEEIFTRFDRDGKITFMEIGTQRGGSLVAWKDYFPNANIYGVDIVDVVLPEYRRNDFTYIVKDIKDPLVKEKLSGITFDVIIDDGSHILSDALFVVTNFLEMLSPNGVLILEDCQVPESWLGEVQNIVPKGYSVTSKDLRDGHSYDNYLIIITKDI